MASQHNDVSLGIQYRLVHCKSQHLMLYLCCGQPNVTVTRSENRSGNTYLAFLVKSCTHVHFIASTLQKTFMCSFLLLIDIIFSLQTLNFQYTYHFLSTYIAQQSCRSCVQIVHASFALCGKKCRLLLIKLKKLSMRKNVFTGHDTVRSCLPL